MVEIAGKAGALASLVGSVRRSAVITGVAVVTLLLLYGSCTAKVGANEFGVEQSRFGLKTGIIEKAYGPGLYFVGIGTTMHTFPREIHILEASFDQAEARAKAHSEETRQQVDVFFAKRDRILGKDTHRVVEALNIQTSDGYAVAADVTLAYSIVDPVRIAKDFGWGTLYVDSFVVNTFRNGVLTTLGKINAEAFYDEAVRIPAIAEAQDSLSKQFAARGFKVENLVVRNYRYAENYEKALQEKKVAVQLAEKNRKESLVNEEKAKLQQIESKGNASITIAESEMNARISKLKAEAELYSSQVRAKGDKEVNVAGAEAKRLKADALTSAGGRYVVALETAKMFDNIDGGVMTPEQYISFIRNAWAVIGVSPGGTAPAAPAGVRR
ncbi:MAG TPA: SPFH domain-containing protein [Thermoanaerobaculia bacterium]